MRSRHGRLTRFVFEAADQADHPEQCPLQGTDRLSMPLRLRPQRAAGEHAESAGSAYHEDDEEPELPTAQPEEHCARKLGESADGTFPRALR